MNQKNMTNQQKADLWNINPLDGLPPLTPYEIVAQRLGTSFDMEEAIKEDLKLLSIYREYWKKHSTRLGGE